MRRAALKKPVSGFTLIELLVSIGMFAILIVGLIAIINPIEQINKLRDSQRKHDLEQIRNAMDQYYNDNNCYPLEIPFGQEWEENGVMYMKKVPSNMEYYCRSLESCYPGYYYQVDAESVCPQWAVLYTHLYSKGTNDTEEKKKNCPLWTRTIIDQNGVLCRTLISAYNYCVFTGQLDCDVINNSGLFGVPSGSWLQSTTTTEGTSTSTSTTASSTSSTSTSTTIPGTNCFCGGVPADFDFRGEGVCNRVETGCRYCDSECSIMGDCE